MYAVWLRVVPVSLCFVRNKSYVNSVVETTSFTVKVELLFVVPVTVIRSKAASFPDPVSVVLVELIVLTPDVEVKLISLPVIVVI